MVFAKEDEVGEVGSSSGFPRLDVVHMGEGHVRTAREPTTSVPSLDLSALALSRKTPGPALVHGVPDIVVDRHRNGGVTGDALHRLAVDQAVPLEFAGQGGRAARVLDQGGQGNMGDHEKGVGRLGHSPPAERISSMKASARR